LSLGGIEVILPLELPLIFASHEALIIHLPVFCACYCLSRSNKDHRFTERDLKGPGVRYQRVNALDMLAAQMWARGDYEEGRKYCSSELELLDRPGLSRANDRWHKRLLASYYANSGVINSREGNYTSALKDLFLSLKLRQEYGDPRPVSVSLIHIGIVYRNQGDYSKALEFYLKAQKIAEAGNDKKTLATLYGNIGNVYGNQQEWASALDYYFKSLKLLEERSDRKGETSTLGNVGLVYMNQYDYEKALDYFTRALKLAEETGDKKSIALNNGNIGLVYRNKENYSEALTFCQRSLEMNELMKNKNGIASQLNNIGTIYIKEHRLTEAEQYFKRAMIIAKEIGVKEWIKDNYRDLGRVDSARGDYRSALRNYKDFILYRDSLKNEENTKKQTQLEMQFVFSKKQASDSIRNAEQVKQEQLKHDQEIAQQRIYAYGGGIGFLLMLIVAAVSFNAYRQKQKANTVIIEQKMLVETKQKEILDSIYYAQRIQKALLPSETYIAKTLNRINV
jgi:tetratricopeptide (TPR) repeat protein